MMCHFSEIGTNVIALILKLFKLYLIKAALVLFLLYFQIIVLSNFFQSYHQLNLQKPPDIKVCALF